MAKELTLTVDTAEVQDLVSKQGKPFKKLVVQADGNTYSKFFNKKDIIPNAGDTVKLTIEEVNTGTATFLNIVDIKALKGPAAKKADLDAPPFKTTTEVKASAPVAKPTLTTFATTTSKDISMELSGLLQALIGTGQYHETKQTDQGTSTFLKEGLLKIHVQRILALKDELAQERK
jgi:hypothetical protein